jgi:5'-AMP-activated protein kinase catalytic alpha subunit
MPQAPLRDDQMAVKQRFGDYLIGGTFARGSFGKIKYGTHIPTNAKLAVKVLSRQKITTSNMDVKIRREIRILRLFRHPSICRLYDVIYTPTEILLIMEFVGPELYDFIVSNGKLKEDAARYVFQQIICALEYCHHFRVVHRDLKPENVLLGANNTVKLIDFGLSNLMQDSIFLKTSCGSPNYAAPEVISGKLYAGPEIDVWSVGVVLYALLCGCLPFDEETIPQLFTKIKKGRYTIPSHVTPGARDLIEKLLVVDPLQRITIPQIRDHPWFLDGLPPHLQFNQITFSKDSRGFSEEAMEQTAELLGMPLAEVRQQLEEREGRAWVCCNIVADQKEAADIQQLMTASRSQRGASVKPAPEEANKAASPPSTSILRATAFETNLGLVLSASPAMQAMLDAPEAMTIKSAYNSGNFVPASLQETKAANVQRLSCSPGMFCIQPAKPVSSSPHTVPVSGSLRAGSLSAAAMTAQLGPGSPEAQLRTGSVSKLDRVYSAEDENYILQNNIGWRIGIMTNYRSTVVMNEIYYILVSMGLQWKALKPFHLAVRAVPGKDSNVPGPYAGIVVTIALFRIQEKHDKGFIIDLTLARGSVIAGMDLIEDITERIKDRLG